MFICEQDGNANGLTYDFSEFWDNPSLPVRMASERPQKVIEREHRAQGALLHARLSVSGRRQPAPPRSMTFDP